MLTMEMWAQNSGLQQSPINSQLRPAGTARQGFPRNMTGACFLPACLHELLRVVVHLLCNDVRDAGQVHVLLHAHANALQQVEHNKPHGTLQRPSRHIYSY